jgi:hypothetical protein
VVRLIFSECVPDYAAYLAPYQVWGVLEGAETPAVAFGRGFLPSTNDLSHFYLARSVRVDLQVYTPPSRVRYAARRCADLSAALTSATAFVFDTSWQALAAGYLTGRWGGSGFDLDRFNRLLRSPLTTHVLTLVNTADDAPAGLATLYAEREVGYYSAAVYDLSRLRSGVGGHLMATALSELQQAGCGMAYLGTCYSIRALYKTRFPGMQFFNGYRWSSDPSELRFLIEHQSELVGTHLLEFGPYRETYLRSGLREIPDTSWPAPPPAGPGDADGVQSCRTGYKPTGPVGGTGGRPSLRPGRG